MAVRLFVGNLSYSTTEADLRTYFGAVAPPSQVVLPVDRETGRPRGFAFVEYLDRVARRDGDSALQRPAAFNGRPLAVSEARAREDRGPGGPGGFSGPRRVASVVRGRARVRRRRLQRPAPRRRQRRAAAAVRSQRARRRRGSRNFGPDAKPQRGTGAKAKKKDAERPRGPIPTKVHRPLLLAG